MATAAAPVYDPDAEYIDHPEMKAIAESLIVRHERFASVANDLRIGYRLRLGEPSGKGEGMMAACVKAPAIWRDETELDIVIWAWEAVWTVLEPRQREALTAHELCHIGRTPKGGIDLRKHDLEEFAWIARQYGRWDDAIAHFAGALERFDADAAGTVTPMRSKGS